MHLHRAVTFVAFSLFLAGCGSSPPSETSEMTAPRASSTTPEPAPAATPETAATPALVSAPSAPPPAPLAALPTSIDLRPRLLELGFAPRPQGHRGTCSIFTTCACFEFAHYKRTGVPLRLSPEFVNWAAGQPPRRPSDGNFFHNALAGFEAHGVCPDASMPYRPDFDPNYAPSPDAAAEAARIRDESGGVLLIRWIVPWEANKQGVADDQLTEIKRVLASGYPVAAGSAHSRLLVGYRDDPALPGGGLFITQDSALNRFDEVTYLFVREQVNDVFWVEALANTAR